MVRVMGERCDRCLFGPDRLVRGARMAEIVRGCREDGNHFVCHIGTLNGRQDVWCRGWWETQETEQMRSFAEMLGAVEYVTEEQVQSAPAWMRRDDE